jgi:hypothetical protein
MGGRARISPTSLWVREDVGEIREGLLFPALVARHAKRFTSTGRRPLNLAWNRSGRWSMALECRTLAAS